MIIHDGRRCWEMVDIIEIDFNDMMVEGVGRWLI